MLERRRVEGAVEEGDVYEGGVVEEQRRRVHACSQLGRMERTGCAVRERRPTTPWIDAPRISPDVQFARLRTVLVRSQPRHLQEGGRGEGLADSAPLRRAAPRSRLAPLMLAPDRSLLSIACEASSGCEQPGASSGWRVGLTQGRGTLWREGARGGS